MALKLEPRYILSLPYGILRLVVIIVSILAMICMHKIDLTPSVNVLIWFTISGSAITSALFIFVFVINFPPTLPCVWSKSEFGILSFWILLYFLSFISCCVMASNYAWSIGINAGYESVAFFCLVNFSIFGYLAYLQHRLSRTLPTEPNFAANESNFTTDEPILYSIE